MTANVVDIENAAYGYGDRLLLSEMSLSLAPGTFHFLTGPSGAGKTTFLKLCYLDLMPSGGGFKIFGRDVQGMGRDDIARARRRIGVVHQDCRFLDHLSVVENVSMPLDVAGRARGEATADLGELMRWVGLEHRTDAFPPELSGGERQRLALARAVIMSPDLILADEPTGNVDWEMSERLLSLLIELNRMGKTIVVATHDLPLIRSAKAQVPARVIRLKGGHIHLAGSEL